MFEEKINLNLIFQIPVPVPVEHSPHVTILKPASHVDEPIIHDEPYNEMHNDWHSAPAGDWHPSPPDNDSGPH